MEDPKREVREIPVEWVIPTGIISRYATNLVVQFTGNEFILHFFEAHPPFTLNPEALDELKSIPAECVARVIVAANRMPELLEVLQTHVSKFVVETKSNGEDE
ncbi:MAG: hypothetical protein U0694_27965 [Anaerolineae bacterium]